MRILARKKMTMVSREAFENTDKFSYYNRTCVKSLVAEIVFLFRGWVLRFVCTDSHLFSRPLQNNGTCFFIPAFFFTPFIALSIN